MWTDPITRQTHVDSISDLHNGLKLETTVWYLLGTVVYMVIVWFFVVDG